MNSLQQQWNTLIQRFGISSLTNNLSAEEQKSKNKQEVCPIPENNAPKTKIAPTQTAPVEDPAPVENIKSQNQSAYENDLRNFR